ncbi:MAG: Ig-like domain-containing protein, partial [Actinomycetota bacterium]|nr:Ig-like domain-containing protein [Actinomycetota bacterium]
TWGEDVGSDVALARYNADGSLDTGFDSDGKLKTDFSGSGDASEEQAWDLAIQPDGKTIVAGQVATTLATARYNQDGSLDSSYGTGGKGNHSTVLMSRPALDFDLNGRPVLAGGSGGFHLARLYGGDDRTAPGPVTAFTATTGGNDVSLAWTNPPDGDFAATRVVRSTSGYATGPLQQQKVYEGTATSYTDAGLAEGRYYYTAFAKDTNGNSSVAGKTSALIDFTAPQGNILDGPSGQTNDATPTFTFGGSDNLSPRAALLYSYKVVPHGVAPDDVAWSDFSASTSATLGGTTGLGQGLHNFYVKVKDQAGNEDGPAERSFTVDTMAPAAPVITDPLNNSYDKDGIIALSGTAEAGTRVQVFEGTTPRGTPVDVSAGAAWSKTLSGVLDGSHTYTVKTTDKAGNTSVASASRTVKVDTNGPTGTVTINSGASSTRSRAVTLTLRATDQLPASGVSLMRFRNENTTTWSSWQTYTTSKSWTLSSGAGTKTVYVQYQDRAGNVSTLARDTITYAP